MLTSPSGSGILSFLLPPDLTQRGYRMLDIYRPASSPGPQHFTPIAVLKLWKMEEKSSLLAQLRSGRTRLLQALQEKTRDSLKEHKIPHVIYFFSLFSKNTQPLKSKVRTVPFLRVHSNPQPRKKLHGEEYLSCWETGPSAEVKCKSNNENTQSFFCLFVFLTFKIKWIHLNTRIQMSTFMIL